MLVADEKRVESLDQVKRSATNRFAATLRIGGLTAEVSTRHAHRELLIPHRESVTAR